LLVPTRGLTSEERNAIVAAIHDALASSPDQALLKSALAKLSREPVSEPLRRMPVGVLPPRSAPANAAPLPPMEPGGRPRFSNGKKRSQRG